MQKYRHRRSLLIGSGAMALSLAVAACSGSGGDTSGARDSGSGTHAKIGLAGSSLLYGTIYQAEEGAFAKNGVNAELVAESTPAVTLSSVLNGDVDFGVGTMTDVINANAKGQQVQAVAGLLTGFPNVFVLNPKVAERSGVDASAPLDERLKALKGLTIGVPGQAGGAVETVLNQMLESAGLDPGKDVTFYYAQTPATLLTAVQTGRVDAGMAAPPQSDEIIRGGKGVAWLDFIRGDYPPVANMLYGVIYAKKSFIASHPAIVQSVVNSFGDAEKSMHTNSDDAQKAVRAHFTQMDPSLYAHAYEFVSGAYPADPSMSTSGYAVTLKVMNSTTPSPKLTVDYSAAVDNLFAEKYNGNSK
ncbi:ABC transporter substrate-binding protein [Streptomyces sp. CLV115]|uniref:ABC transporter substrate-binding protein n=1 Tax=Streptomyces sp. CLV115 TaxID=3138502 RepID=UPI00313E2153